MPWDPEKYHQFQKERSAPFEDLFNLIEVRPDLEVVDLGCGEGRLLGLLLKEPQFRRIVGVDVSLRALEIGAERLKLERLAPSQRERIELWQGALTYRDRRLEGFDAACAKSAKGSIRERWAS